MPMLKVGDLAPDLEAEQADGTTVSLLSLRGRFVLVYFYPRDNSPGCTTEACALNDGLDQLQFFRADVIGVSRQTQESHRGFRRRNRLRFALASDREGAVAAAWGVPRFKGLLPANARVSFLIDPDGKVSAVWPQVEPRLHAGEVLQEVERQHSALEAAQPSA